MKSIAIVSFIGMILLSCGQERTTVHELENYPLGAQVETYNEIPGLSKVTFTDPKNPEVIFSEGDYKDGKKHGIWIEYDPDRQIPVLIQTYYEGQLQGVEIKLDNGAITEKTYFHNGDRHGQTLLYNKIRKVKEMKNYKYGVLEGIVKKYYDRGGIMEESPYVNGKLDGLAKWYDQEGNLKFQYLYDEGELVDDNPPVAETTDN